MKKKYPFRLGTTSYILPADIMTNVRYLAPRVDDIELLLFESDEMAELPDAWTIAELRHIGGGEGLTYTVHLPLDSWLGDGDEDERERSVSKCTRTIEKMRPLEAVAWVLHCNRGGMRESRISDDAEWVAAVEKSVDEILRCGVVPGTVCVETLDASFPLLVPFIKARGLSICLDVGHLVLYGLPIDEYVRKYLDSAPVIHLHGVVNGKDHRDISGVDPSALAALFSALQTDAMGNRVVTLEVFNENDLGASLRIVERYCV